MSAHYPGPNKFTPSGINLCHCGQSHLYINYTFIPVVKDASALIMALITPKHLFVGLVHYHGH